MENRMVFIPAENFQELVSEVRSLRAKLDEISRIEKAPLTRKEAANYLGISIVLLHRLVNEGRINTVKAGRRTLFPISELQRFVESNRK